MLGVFAVFMHLMFLLYLHFAYHDLAEEISHSLLNQLPTLPPMMKQSGKIDNSIILNNERKKGKIKIFLNYEIPYGSIKVKYFHFIEVSKRNLILAVAANLTQINGTQF